MGVRGVIDVKLADWLSCFLSCRSGRSGLGGNRDLDVRYRETKSCVARCVGYRFGNEQQIWRSFFMRFVAVGCGLVMGITVA